MNFCIRREIIHKNITRRIKKNYNSICILSKSDHNKNIPSFLFLFGFACGCFLLLLLGRLVQFFLFFSWISNQITYDHEHEKQNKNTFPRKPAFPHWDDFFRELVFDILFDLFHLPHQLEILVLFHLPHKLSLWTDQIRHTLIESMPFLLIRLFCLVSPISQLDTFVQNRISVGQFLVEKVQFDIPQFDDFFRLGQWKGFVQRSLDHRGMVIVWDFDRRHAVVFNDFQTIELGVGEVVFQDVGLLFDHGTNYFWRLWFSRCSLPWTSQLSRKSPARNRSLPSVASHSMFSGLLAFRFQIYLQINE